MDIPFDPVVTLIVFIIGVPALVFQFMPSDVRRVVFDDARKKQLLLDLGVPIFSATILVIMGVLTEYILPSLAMFHDMKWTLIIIALVIITGRIGIFVPLRYGRREMIVKALEREAIQSFQKNTRLKEKPVNDLAGLGISAESGQEQQFVLEAMHELMKKIVCSPEYNGDSLETPILKLIEIVTLNSDIRNITNLRFVAEILRNVVLEKKEIEFTTDLQNTIKVISSLGGVAITQFERSLEIDNVVISCIQTLDLIANGYPSLKTDVSQALFEIGSLATKYQREFVGIAALNKLMNLLNSSMEAESELIADTLGLVAHFWILKGSQREFSEQCFLEIKNIFGKSYRDALRKSYQHWVNETQFYTADLIFQMARGLRVKI